MSPGAAGPPALRLFVALDLPADTIAQLDSWRAGAYARRPEFRLVPAENLHVTVVFLGNVAKSDLDQVAACALDRRPGEIELLAKAIVALPNGRPRLHAIDFTDVNQELTRWQAVISQRLADAGLCEPERRPYRPHLTIARVKRGQERQVSKLGSVALPEHLAGPMSPVSAVLYRSITSPSGARYEPLREMPLK